MLVISRRLGEGIVINGNIHITVVKVGRGRIRLGLTAPATVRIHRREELDGESPDGVESLGGASVADGVAVLPFSLTESTEETGREIMAARGLDFPELVESEHGAGDSHLGSR